MVGNPWLPGLRRTAKLARKSNDAARARHHPPRRTGPAGLTRAHRRSTLLTDWSLTKCSRQTDAVRCFRKTAKSPQPMTRPTATIRPDTDAKAAKPPGRGRGPRWERRKESRPSELLDAALDVFVERGFASARLDDVAARAGVSKGTLYLYYDNKEELFKAVVRQTILPLIAQFRAAIERSDQSGSQLLQEFVWSWWNQFGNTRLSGIAKLCISEAGNFPEVARFWNDEVIASNNELLTMILSRGIAAGEFRAVDLESMAHQIMAPLVLKAIWRQSIEPCCVHGASLDPARFIVHHLDILLRGLGATPSSSAAPCAVGHARSATANP